MNAILIAALLAAQTLTRVSVDSQGKQAKDDSGGGVISADGRYAVFASSASNLVPGDTNGYGDIFRRDLLTGEVIRVNLSSAGEQQNDNQGGGDSRLSQDGRFVVWSSMSTDLAPGGWEYTRDVFVRDCRLGTTERISLGHYTQSFASGISADGSLVSLETFGVVYVQNRTTGARESVDLNSDGERANAPCYGGAMSADGRFVVFYSEADNLSKIDTNEASDAFVRDRLLGLTEMVSLSSLGRQGNDHSFVWNISADGRFVAFGSLATNLIPGNTHGALQTYVRDRDTGLTFCASLNANGHPASGDTVGVSLSGDGRFVVFESLAGDLVPGDINETFDVFVHDLMTGTTRLVSANAAGEQGNGYSFSGPQSISGDGTLVVFDSHASNFVHGDTNQTDDVFVAASPLDN